MVKLIWLNLFCVTILSIFQIVCGGKYDFNGVTLSRSQPVPNPIQSVNGAFQCPASLFPPVQPETLADLLLIVQNAIRQNYTLNPVGTLQSATDIICTDGLPIGMQRINHFSYNDRTKRVTVGAGATMGNFMEQLHLHGRTLTGLPVYSDGTVGGSLGTGIHGSTLRDAATLADQIVSLRVIDGRGNLRNVTNPFQLRAFKTHLGLLGIVYDVTFETVPQHKFHIRNYQVSEDVLFNGEIFRRLASFEKFRAWWIPTSKKVVLSEGQRVPLNTHGSCRTMFIPEGPLPVVLGVRDALETMQEEHDFLGMHILQSSAKLSLYSNVPGRSPIYTDDGKTLCTPAIGFNHRITMNRCSICAWDHGNMSVRSQDFVMVVPLTEFASALKTMKAIFDKYPVEFPLMGLLFRFMRASDGYLMMNEGRDSASIEWVLAPRAEQYRKPMMGLAAFQAITQAMFERHQGRAHWAKSGLFYMSDYRLLRQAYEHFPTYLEVLKEFDPNGVFMNDFGRRITDPNYHRTAIDRFVEHCGLVDNCICQKDEDCGDGTRESYKCGKLLGYNVCRERDEFFNVWKGRQEEDPRLFRADVVRHFISKWNP